MDYALFCAVALLLFAAIQTWAWGGHRNNRLLFASSLLCLVILSSGWFLVDAAGRRAQAFVEDMLRGYASTYAAEMKVMGHEHLTMETSHDDPRYLTIIEAEKRWLAANKRIADVYTFRRMADGRIVVMVDSETDYDRNGRIEGDREQRTPIGETYNEATAVLRAAFDGKAAFDPEMVTDRWGTWVSAFEPLRDSAGNIEAVLGIDFDAAEFTVAIRSSRLFVMGYLAVLVGVVVGASVMIGRLSGALNRTRLAEAELMRTRDALLQSEQRFRALVDNANETSSIWDEQGRIILSTHAVERVIGYTPDELLGRHAAELVHEEDRSDFQLAFYALREEPGKNVTTRARVLHRDGRWRLVEGVFTNLQHDPAVSGIVVNYWDITDRAAAEAALRESEARLQAFLENSPALIFTKDAGGRYMQVNRSWCQALGLAAEEVIGKTDLEIFPKEQAEAFAADDRAVLSAVSALRFEESASQSDGEHTYLVQKFPLPDANGRLVALGGIATDITERHRVEQSLRRSEERYRSLVESARDAIFTLSTEGWITSFNSAAAIVTGFHNNEYLGKPFLPLVHPEDSAQALELFEQVLRDEKPAPFELRVLKKDGSYVPLECTITALVEDGNVTGVIGIARDISLRRELEDQLRQAQKMESVGQLAGGVAHDFNNLLTVIQGNASLVLEEKLDPGSAGMVRDIVEAAERAATLTRQLLAFSRRQTMITRDLDLNETIIDLTRMLRRLLGEHITLRVDSSSAPTLARADSGMIEQVLLNLAVNARDAMPEGGQLTVGTTNVHFDEHALLPSSSARAGNFVCISVSDTGSGIALEHLAHIFEPFFTTKDVGKGTGLGLSTVYGIVKQHHGWVEVQSEFGQGTTFRVYLPATEQKAMVGPIFSIDEGMPRGNETILVVEDEAAVRSVVLNTLKRLGYRVLEAASGVEALKVWDEYRNEIDLLLTDVVMPDGISGPQLARELRKQEPNLKVIFTSGYSARLLESEGRVEGSMIFLQKPYTPKKLAELIRDTLQKDKDNG